MNFIKILSIIAFSAILIIGSWSCEDAMGLDENVLSVIIDSTDIPDTPFRKFEINLKDFEGYFIETVTELNKPDSIKEYAWQYSINKFGVTVDTSTSPATIELDIDFESPSRDSSQYFRDMKVAAFSLKFESIASGTYDLGASAIRDSIWSAIYVENYVTGRLQSYEGQTSPLVLDFVENYRYDYGGTITAELRADFFLERELKNVSFEGFMTFSYYFEE